MALSLLWSCGNNETKQSQKELHLALLNPVVKPYTEALELDSTNADLYFKRAEMLNKIEMLDLTLSDLENAVRLDPKNVEYRESLASLLIDNGKSDLALAQVKILKEQVPNDTNYVLMEAQAYLAGNKTVEASKIVYQLLNEMPTHPYVLLEASKIAAAEKDTTKAIDYAQQIAKHTPQFYDGIYQLADLYNATHNAKAVEWYQQLYKMDTLNAYPFYDIAKYYQGIGNTNGTKQYLVKAVMVDRDFVRAYLDYGNLLLKEDSLDKADRQFQIATEVAPANAEAYFGKGVVNLKKGKNDLAKQFFEQALVFNNKHEAAQKALTQLK